MGFFDGIGDFFGDVVGAALPIAGGAIGTAIGGPVGGAIGSSLGGGIGGAIAGGPDQPSAPGGGMPGGAMPGGGYGGIPLDYYAGYGAAAAQAQLPLTLAATRFGGANASNVGALSLLAQTQSTGQLGIVQDALTRSAIHAQNQANLNQLAQASRGNLAFAQQQGANALNQRLGEARLGVGLLEPQFIAQSAAAARAGDNDLALSQGKTNQGLRALEQSAKLNLAQQYAADLGSIAKTRATAMGNLALGSQRIAGQLALGDQNIFGNLTLNKAKTESDIARTRATADATKDLRANAAKMALGAQRSFA